MKTLLILFSLLTLPATACLWVEGTNLHGEHRRTEGVFPDKRLTQALLTDPEDKIKQLLSSQTTWKPGSISQKEFEGVKELLSGNHDRAITLLQQLEAGQPGRYGTAANLGTAYELKGDLDSALKWIQEAIRRNPDSHHGTEWLHVEILKTRIQLRENPHYLHDRRVIPLPESFTAATSILIGEATYSVHDIADAIYYQLQERMIFVKAPDPVVADLLFTFGRLEARNSVIESARRLLNMSYNYGFANPSLITREINLYDESETRQTIFTVLWITLSVVVLAACITFAWKTKRFFLTGKAYRQHRAVLARKP